MEVHKHAKQGVGQYPAMLTKYTWSKRTYHMEKENHFPGVILSGGQDSTTLPAQMYPIRAHDLVHTELATKSFFFFFYSGQMLCFLKQLLCCVVLLGKTLSLIVPLSSQVYKLTNFNRFVLSKIFRNYLKFMSM